MTPDEEKLFAALDLLYGWVHNANEKRLYEVDRVVEPLLRRFESNTLRYVERARLQRRAIGGDLSTSPDTH